MKDGLRLKEELDATDWTGVVLTHPYSKTVVTEDVTTLVDGDRVLGSTGGVRCCDGERLQANGAIWCTWLVAGSSVEGAPGGVGGHVCDMRCRCMDEEKWCCILR